MLSHAPPPLPASLISSPPLVCRLGPAAGAGPVAPMPAVGQPVGPRSHADCPAAILVTSLRRRRAATTLRLLRARTGGSDVGAAEGIWRRRGGAGPSRPWPFRVAVS